MQFAFSPVYRAVVPVGCTRYHRTPHCARFAVALHTTATLVVAVTFVLDYLLILISSTFNVYYIHIFRLRLRICRTHAPHLPFVHALRSRSPTLRCGYGLRLPLPRFGYYLPVYIWLPHFVPLFAFATRYTARYGSPHRITPACRSFTFVTRTFFTRSVHTHGLLLYLPLPCRAFVVTGLHGCVYRVVYVCGFYVAARSLDFVGFSLRSGLLPFRCRSRFCYVTCRLYHFGLLVTGFAVVHTFAAVWLPLPFAVVIYTFTPFIVRARLRYRLRVYTWFHVLLILPTFVYIAVTPFALYDFAFFGSCRWLPFTLLAFPRSTRVCLPVYTFIVALRYVALRSAG